MVKPTKDEIAERVKEILTEMDETVQTYIEQIEAHLENLTVEPRADRQSIKSIDSQYGGDVEFEEDEDDEEIVEDDEN